MWKIKSFFRELLIKFYELKLAWALKREEEKLSKDLENEVDYYFNSGSDIRPEVIIKQTEEKYAQGMANMRQGMAELAAKHGGNHLAALQEFTEDPNNPDAKHQSGAIDLLSLGRRETQQQMKHRKYVESAYHYKNSDIKSDKDKEKMIDKRIRDYNTLHKHKESRNLQRKIRVAHLSGDIKKAKELEAEWRKKFHGRNTYD